MHTILIPHRLRVRVVAKRILCCLRGVVHYAIRNSLTCLVGDAIRQLDLDRNFELERSFSGYLNSPTIRLCKVCKGYVKSNKICHTCYRGKWNLAVRNIDSVGFKENGFM